MKAVKDSGARNARSNNSSLESYITRILAVFSLALLICIGALLAQLNFSNWDIAVICTVAALALAAAAYSFRRKILSAINRGLLHIEAVRMEEYNQYAKAEFEKGCVGEFHNELKALSLHLQGQKSRYDQHAFLVYQLIDQLDNPILVFNQKNKLSYANGAFSQLYNEPWQMFRHASPKLLGLEKQGTNWQLAQRSGQWQISQSEFIDAGEAHQLLVFTNIESALRASQLNAWQQIIRVMSHEIRNSLTPVSSLAQSLSARSESARDQQALAVISERCHHLQDFISRYSSLSQQLTLNCKRVEIEPLIARIDGLFSGSGLKFSHNIDNLWADQTFLDQVLINLIKNAREAGATAISVNFAQNKDHNQIKVVDNGHGFSNFDNLFVPLFTTKAQGQGIGLSFCRNIIEHHRGTIELTNNPDAGVSVIINLPRS